MPRGRFITFEGQDGAGKTTSLGFVEDLVTRRGIEVVVTREPGGTALGEALRRLLLDGHDLGIDAMAELLMVFAARAQHVNEKIVPALARGAWVLSDRFTDATYAYQGAGRGLPWGRIAALESMVHGDLNPDLTLLIDVDPQVGRTRTRRRPEAGDRFESEAAEFNRRVREAYLDLARMHPERMKVIDGSVPLDQVQARIRDVVERYLETGAHG